MLIRLKIFSYFYCLNEAKSLKNNPAWFVLRFLTEIVSKSLTRWLETLFNIWPLKANKICPIAQRFAKVDLKLCQTWKNPEKFPGTFRTLPKWCKILTNLVTLMDIDTQNVCTNAWLCCWEYCLWSLIPNCHNIYLTMHFGTCKRRIS